MQDKTEYMSIVQPSAELLDKAVNDFFDKGWVCQGGSSVIVRQSGSLLYLQAMVRTVAGKEMEEVKYYPDAFGEDTPDVGI